MNKPTLRPTPTALLNPRLDPTFKAMFTQETKDSEDALKSFISSVLGRKIRKVRLTSNEPSVDTTDQMQMSFDVSVIFDDGENASIEMQGRSQEYDYAVRSEIQAARLLNNNARKGDDWNAERIYQISVLNFHYPKDDKSEQTWYTMKNQKGQELAGHLNVIFIDLLVIKKLIGTPIEKLTALQKWGLYLSYADDETKADYISQIANSEEGIMKARSIIHRMSQEDENWFREFSYDKARRDYNTSMSIATKKGLEKGLKEGREKGLKEGREKGLKEGREKGLEEGRKEGLKEGRKEGLKEGRKEGGLEKAMEMASKMLAKNYSISEISELTGLSTKQIEELKK